MYSETNNGVSINTPLIVQQYQNLNQNKLQDAESNHGFVFNNSSGSTSVFKTCFNGLNALSGIGILSIPYALASGGWLSLVFFFIIAITTFYTSLLLQRCMDVDPNIRTYPDIGELAFGKHGRRLVSFVMFTELYLVATGFLILEGDNLHNLFPGFEFKLARLIVSGKQGFIVIVALLILPTVWVDNLSVLSYVSMSGVLASVVILGSILCTGALDGIGFSQKGTLINWAGIPTSVSLYAFCFCAHPVFPTLYDSMRRKHQFSNVMLICFILCTISYASMAIIGYMMFGLDVQSQITLNLPTNKLSSKIAIYTTLVNPVAKYALMIMPIVQAAQTWFPCYNKNMSFKLLLRTVLVISTVVVALAIPFFGYLMTLVGALLSVTASVLLPCLCYLKISGNYRRFSHEMLCIGAIVVMGLIIAIVGTYTSLADIARQVVGFHQKGTVLSWKGLPTAVKLVLVLLFHTSDFSHIVYFYEEQASNF